MNSHRLEMHLGKQSLASGPLRQLPLLPCLWQHCVCVSALAELCNVLVADRHAQYSNVPLPIHDICADTCEVRRRTYPCPYEPRCPVSTSATLCYRPMCNCTHFDTDRDIWKYSQKDPTSFDWLQSFLDSVLCRSELFRRQFRSIQHPQTPIAVLACRAFGATT